jgi:hypothetical protein
MDQLRAAAAPTVAPLAPPPLPPLMPTLLAPASSVEQVVVFFDLESRGSDDVSCNISEMAATAIYILADGTWGVPPGGRFGTHVTRARSFTDAVCHLNAFVERVSAAAGYAPLHMLAHNGPNYDWRVLTRALIGNGLALSPCISTLGNSQDLFVAEKLEELGTKWSMKRLYEVRFNGAKIPNAHEALADVSAMERIAVNVVSTNGSAKAIEILKNIVLSSKSPAAFVEKYTPK